MAKPRSNLRLFVAIYPPPGIAQQMIDTLELLQPLPNLRVTSADQLHLTLQFIGDTPVKDLADMIESIQRSTAGVPPFVLQPLRLISLPARGLARLIAMETNAPPPLLELHRRLVHRFAQIVRGKGHERFTPHFTLGRFRSPASGVHVRHDVTMEEFDVDRIRLMRSTLHTTGAEHHEVAAYTLTSGRAEGR